MGCQYYRAPLSTGEVAHLVRDEENAHDENAIMVCNHLNHQVGYLKRELAAALAPSIDSNILEVLGYVPEDRAGEKSPYFIPLSIRVYGQGPAAQEGWEQVQLAEQCMTPDGMLIRTAGHWRMNFGRHAGAPLEAVAAMDPSYLDWMAQRASFSPAVRMHADAALAGAHH